MMALLLVNTAEYLGDLLFSYDMCFFGEAYSACSLSRNIG